MNNSLLPMSVYPGDILSEIHTKDGVKVAYTTSVEDAHYIADCLNACEGFTHEGLKQCLADGDTILNRLAGWQMDCVKAEQQRDKLFDSLKDLVLAWEKGDDIFGAIQQARAVIAESEQ
jgi:hypothetical protein